MNERIKKLGKELGPVATIGNWGRVEWADNVYPQFGDKMYAAVDLEKFAELIVRDCVGVVKWTPTGVPHNTIIKNIKQHFGVEE